MRLMPRDVVGEEIGTRNVKSLSTVTTRAKVAGMDVDHAAAVTIGPRIASVDLDTMTVHGEGITGATLTGRNNGVVMGIAIELGLDATASHWPSGGWQTPKVCLAIPAQDLGSWAGFANTFGALDSF